MNRKLAMSGFSMVAAVLLLGGSAFAAFSGSATATGNTFSTGDADLQISLTNSGFSSSIVNPFNGTNIVPGYSQTTTFYLKNNSTGNLPLNLSTTFDAVVNSGFGISSELTAQFTCENLTTNVITSGGTFSIDAMDAGSVNLGSLAPGEVSECDVTFALPMSSTAEGSGVVFDAVFNGTQ